MTQYEIISLAREAGFKTESWTNSLHISVYANGVEIGVGDKLERFAALVAQNYMAKACRGCVIKQCYKRMDTEIEAAVLAEREACAKVCEARYNSPDFNDEAVECADAIRARGEK